MELGTHTVAEAFLLSDAGGQAGVQESAPQHEVAEHHRRVIRIRVLDGERHGRDEKRAGLVRRFDGSVDDVHLGDAIHNPREGRGALPVTQRLVDQRLDSLGVKVAYQGQLAG